MKLPIITHLPTIEALLLFLIASVPTPNLFATALPMFNNTSSSSNSTFPLSQNPNNLGSGWCCTVGCGTCIWLSCDVLDCDYTTFWGSCCATQSVVFDNRTGKPISGTTVNGTNVSFVDDPEGYDDDDVARHIYAV